MILPVAFAVSLSLALTLTLTMILLPRCLWVFAALASPATLSAVRASIAMLDGWSFLARAMKPWSTFVPFRFARAIDAAHSLDSPVG